MMKRKLTTKVLAFGLIATILSSPVWAQEGDPARAGLTAAERAGKRKENEHYA